MALSGAGKVGTHRFERGTAAPGRATQGTVQRVFIETSTRRLGACSSTVPSPETMSRSQP